jgi:uncharacterized coiled-coil protein SlyX
MKQYSRKTEADITTLELRKSTVEQQCESLKECITFRNEDLNKKDETILKLNEKVRVL